MRNLIIAIIFLIGLLVHIFFLQLNEVIKVADSFAYLQMSHFLKDFSMEGFGTGWFGFLYSIPIAIIDFFLNNDTLAAKIVNILSFFISSVLIFKIGSKYLSYAYNLLFLIIFFLSSTLIHYNIHILSENIYLPIFLGLILYLINNIHKISIKANIINVNGESIFIPNTKRTIKFTVTISFFLALMYYTRGEAFIYIGSFFLFTFIYYIKGYIRFKKVLSIYVLTLVSFSILVLPYIFYLHSFTGERGLSNKGASNLRQASMRGTKVLDDIGFEKAVGELNEDKHSLIAGFAGGLKYEKPTIDLSLKDYFLDNKRNIFNRFLFNQKKLYTSTIPKLLIGDSYKAYSNPNLILHNSIIYLLLLTIPGFFFLYGFYKLIRSKNQFLLITVPFYLVASIFFTLFFIIDRYFLIFIPLFILVIIYGVQELFYKKESDSISAESFIDTISILNKKYILIAPILIFIYIIGAINYFYEHKEDDKEYLLKKEAGIWLKENKCLSTSDLLKLKIEGETKTKIECSYKIMERFPIVTYYSNSKTRWLTPYTDKLSDIIEYAKFNKINYLVVDTMDFKTYRPKLDFLLDTDIEHKGLKLIKEFENIKELGNKKIIEKVILYRIKI